jgi:hypothetical protein
LRNCDGDVGASRDGLIHSGCVDHELDVEPLVAYALMIVDNPQVDLRIGAAVLRE